MIASQRAPSRPFGDRNPYEYADLLLADPDGA